MAEFALRPGFVPGDRHESAAPVAFTVVGVSAGARASTARDFARRVLTLARDKVSSDLAGDLRAPGGAGEPPGRLVRMDGSGVSAFTLRRRRTWTVRARLVIDGLLRTGEIEQGARATLAIDALLAPDRSKRTMVDFDDDARAVADRVCRAIRDRAAEIAPGVEFASGVTLD